MTATLDRLEPSQTGSYDTCPKCRRNLVQDRTGKTRGFRLLDFVRLWCPREDQRCCFWVFKDVFCWRRGAGSNRRIKVLQTSALPLGYRANARTRFPIIRSSISATQFPMDELSTTLRWCFCGSDEVRSRYACDRVRSVGPHHQRGAVY